MKRTALRAQPEARRAPPPGRTSGDQRPAGDRRALRKRMLIMLLVVGVVFGGVFGWGAVRSYFIKQFFASMGAPPQTVSTTVATAQEWQP
ncbi:MAG TPA: hypothetical protein VF502_00820, partial [Stellaceae bacterium]